jgi:hypothetical protein
MIRPRLRRGHPYYTLYSRQSDLVPVGDEMRAETASGRNGEQATAPTNVTVLRAGYPHYLARVAGYPLADGERAEE